MNKETFAAIMKMLDTSSNEELHRIRNELLVLKQGITTDEGKSDVNLALRYLDEELSARVILKK